MSQLAPASRFACDDCGKSYGWKRELANKRVKCKCGHTMTVPDLSAPKRPSEPFDDGPPKLPGDDIYDFIDAAPALAPPRAVAVAAAAPIVAAAVAAPAGRKPQPLGYRGGPTPRERARAGLDQFHNLKRDVYVPLGIMVGSFLIYLGWLAIRGHAGSLPMFAAIMSGLFLGKTVVMVGAAFIVAPMAGVSFGPIWTAILKLAAVSMAPDVFASILEDCMHFQGSGFVAGGLALGLYWGLMSLLFHFDASDAWTVVIYFGVLRYILSILVTMFLIGALFSGGAATAGLGRAARAGASSMSPSAADFDGHVADMMDNNRLLTATEIFDRGRQSAMRPKVDAIKAAGAANVWFAVHRDINGKAEPESLIVQWPDGAEARKTMLAAFETYRTTSTHESTPFTDDRGMYMQLPLASK